jgi:hypothetical protein
VVEPPAPDDVEQTFSALAVALFSAGTVDGTLREIVALAEDAVEGCDAAGVLVVGNDEVLTTSAASGPLVDEIEGLQIRLQEGPCFDAATTGMTFYAEDLVDDVRWPRFGPEAVEAGVRSVLAVTLSADRLSALNLYARLPAAFGATDRAKAQLFATLARLALDSAEERRSDDERSENFRAALMTRELIGQAQGILMERERITADQAFDVLRRASQHLNVKLRQVAEDLIESGESPDAGPSSPSAT